MDNIEVKFHLFIDGDNTLSEQDIKDRIKEIGPKLRSADTYEGTIDIQTPMSELIKIEDELPALVKNFCFSPIPDLLTGKNVVIRYYNHYGYLRLDPEGRHILMSGDGIPTVRIERNRLLPEIYNCGQRFIHFLNGLKDDENGNEIRDLIDFLTEYGRKAHESLINVRLMPGETKFSNLVSN